MKKSLWLLCILFISATVMAQATPHEKKEVTNDLVKERDKRTDVAKDVLRGQPARAREDHRAAIMYHKQAVRKTQQIHRRHLRRKHVVVIHHPRHRRPHRPVVVIHH